MLNFDPQLSRRFYPVEMRVLHGETAPLQAIAILKTYCERVGLVVAGDLMTTPFSIRLLQASDREFGLMIELILGAIEEALLADAMTLDIGHFAAAFDVNQGALML